MKTLTTHINEALKIGKDISSFSTYSCQPKTKPELKEIIMNRIDKEGPYCNLNDIDVSLIKDMSYLFYESDFNGDISKWNTSNVIYMDNMFTGSKFNNDISEWNVDKVKNMNGMFRSSEFNKDISNWNINSTISMISMFAKSKFNKDISNWKINKNCDTLYMFDSCPIKQEYKPKKIK